MGHRSITQNDCGFWSNNFIQPYRFLTIGRQICLLDKPNYLSFRSTLPLVVGCFSWKFPTLRKISTKTHVNLGHRSLTRDGLGRRFYSNLPTAEMNIDHRSTPLHKPMNWILAIDRPQPPNDRKWIQTIDLSHFPNYWKWILVVDLLDLAKISHTSSIFHSE